MNTAMLKSKHYVFNMTLHIFTVRTNAESMDALWYIYVYIYI